MHVILTVAGKSERFWPLRDKALVPICGTTPMQYQLDVLRQAGLTQITIVASQSNQAEVRRLVTDLPIVIQEDDGSLGTRGALLSALPDITDDWVLVVAGTDLVDVAAYKGVLAAVAKPGTDGVMLGKRMTTHFPGGYFSVEGDRIVGIVEKPKPGEEPSDLVNIVIHAHKREPLLQALKDIADEKGDGYSQAEQILMQRSTYVLAPYEGDWYAFKYAWDPIKALPLFLRTITTRSIHPSATIDPTATIDGPIIIGEGASVLPGAVISGPAYLGAHTVVGAGTIINGGSYASHCLLEDHCQLTNNVCYPNVTINHSTISNSVLGDNVSLASSCATSETHSENGETHSVVRGKALPTGLRLFGTAVGEGSHLQMGVHLDAGVKVGRGCSVGDGLHLTEDVLDGQIQP